MRLSTLILVFASLLGACKKSADIQIPNGIYRLPSPSISVTIADSSNPGQIIVSGNAGYFQGSIMFELTAKDIDIPVPGNVIGSYTELGCAGPYQCNTVKLGAEQYNNCTLYITQIDESGAVSGLVEGEFKDSTGQDAQISGSFYNIPKSPF